MYYQADFSHSHKMFRYLLVASILVHALVLWTKNSEMTFRVSSPETFSETLRVQLREKVLSQPTPVPKKKVVKKLKRKKVSPAKKEVVKRPQKITKAAPAAPQTKAFKSFINNYFQPHYPRIALRRGITGRVGLILLVLGDGQLKEVLISKSSGNVSLDNSALDAAKKWTFNKISTNPKTVYSLSKTHRIQNQLKV